MGFNFRNIYKNDLFVLSLMGAHPNENNNYRLIYKLQYYIVNFCFLGIFNTGAVINWIIESDSLKNFTALGYIILILTMGEIKSIFLYLNRDHFGTIVSDLNVEAFQPRGDEEVNIIKKVFGHYASIRKVLLLVCWVAIFGACTTGLFSGKKYMLPIASWYPINIYSSPVFEIVYVHQATCITLIGCFNTYTEITLSGFLTFIGAQCDLLSYRLEKLGRQGPISRESWINYIQHYNLILGFRKTTEKAFGNIYFFQIFASTTALCMALFLLTLIEPSFEYYYLIIYLCSVANLLLVPCWFATEMTRKIIRTSMSYFAVLQNLNMADRELNTEA